MLYFSWWTWPRQKERPGWCWRIFGRCTLRPTCPYAPCCPGSQRRTSWLRSCLNLPSAVVKLWEFWNLTKKMGVYDGICIRTHTHIYKYIYNYIYQVLPILLAMFSGTSTFVGQSLNIPDIVPIYSMNSWPKWEISRKIAMGCWGTMGHLISDKYVVEIGLIGDCLNRKLKP